MGKVWTADLKYLKTDWNKPYLTEAPYLVLLFKQTHGYTEDGSQKINHYYNEISCSISAGRERELKTTIISLTPAVSQVCFWQLCKMRD